MDSFSDSFFIIAAKQSQELQVSRNLAYDVTSATLRVAYDYNAAYASVQKKTMYAT